MARRLLVALLFQGILMTIAWNTSVTLVDPSRSSLLHPHGRQVKAFVCHGDGEVGPLPLYVWAHGFDCGALDYEWLCQISGVVTALVLSSDLVPFLPDTKDLALDQAFLTLALPAAARNESSPLHGLLSGQAVLGGHSMGGGTSVLAADPSFAPHSNVTALALVAPGLYTLPPAYSHRTSIVAPILIVSGAVDCGPNALPREALPLYSTVHSQIKALVVLKGVLPAATMSLRCMPKKLPCHMATLSHRHSQSWNATTPHAAAILLQAQTIASGPLRGTAASVLLPSATRSTGPPSRPQAKHWCKHICRQCSARRAGSPLRPFWLRANARGRGAMLLCTTMRR